VLRSFIFFTRARVRKRIGLEFDFEGRLHRRPQRKQAWWLVTILARAPTSVIICRLLVIGRLIPLLL